LRLFAVASLLPDMIRLHGDAISFLSATFCGSCCEKNEPLSGIFSYPKLPQRIPLIQLSLRVLYLSSRDKKIL